MKINISFTPEALDGYTNHSILVNQGNVELNFCDVGEAEEILAPSVIEALPRQILGPILQNWASKLAHKGRLIIDFIDCYTVSRMFFLQQLTVNDFNFLMHGEMSKGWDEKKQNFTIPQVNSSLEGLGLKVVSKKLDGVKVTIIAERP